MSCARRRQLTFVGAQLAAAVSCSKHSNSSSPSTNPISQFHCVNFFHITTVALAFTFAFTFTLSATFLFALASAYIYIHIHILISGLRVKAFKVNANAHCSRPSAHWQAPSGKLAGWQRATGTGALSRAHTHRL